MVVGIELRLSWSQSQEPRTRNVSRSPMWMAGTQLLKLSPARVCIISRKLESGTEPELKPRHSDRKQRIPNWELNY